jgi:hypothetical protein
VIRLLLIVALLAGCSADPIGTTQTDNAQIKVERLFDHEGCTVYRFYDNGARYFVKCGASSRVEWIHQRQCGKTPCPRADSIETVRAQEGGA